jgi:uncharacterized protein (TIGR00266 family)
VVQHEIIGDDMQAVILSLAAGDVVRAEAGAMMFMTDAIEMDAKMEGGLLGGLKRKFLAGESFFITHFRAQNNAGRVAFAGPYPGKIIDLEIARGQQVLCQKDSFLCAVGEIDLSIAFTRRIGAGFFGGEGFILQKIEGQGKVFMHSGGTIVPMQLGAGEQLKVTPGVSLRSIRASTTTSSASAASRPACSGERDCSLRPCAGPGGCGCRRCPSRAWRTGSMARAAETEKRSSAILAACSAVSVI